MDKFKNGNSGDIASKNADNGSGVHCPGKFPDAIPEKKSSVRHAPKRQRETYLHAIRRRCLDCAGSSREVVFCTTWDCALHPYRFGVRPGTFGDRLASEFSPKSGKAGGERHWKPEWPLIRSKPTRTPLKTIRQHCLWCSGTSQGVAECGSGNCPLHLLRFGKDTRRKKRRLNPEQKAKFLKQMKSGSGSAKS
jgi:hypothetical protein